MSETVKAQIAPSINGYKRAIVFVQKEIDSGSLEDFLKDRVLKKTWMALDWIAMDLGHLAPSSQMIYSFAKESLSDY